MRGRNSQPCGLMLRVIISLSTVFAFGQTQAADSFSGPDFKSLVRKAEPLPVGESLKAFDVPDGFEMELVKHPFRLIRQQSGIHPSDRDSSVASVRRC